MSRGGELETFGSTGKRGLDELLRRMEARVSKLEAVPTTTTPQVQTVTVPTGGSSIIVRSVDGTFSKSVQGLEIDQAAGFAFTQDGGLAKITLPSLTTGAGTFTGDLAHQGSKVGFFNTTPASRPAAYTMTYSTGSRTNSNLTATNVSTTASTQTTPYGYATQAQADALPVAVNALIADVLNLKQVLTQVVADLKTIGLLQ